MVPPHMHRELSAYGIDQVGCKVHSEHAKHFGLQYEEDSTDVGSGLSDVESVCSSVARSGRKANPSQGLSRAVSMNGPQQGSKGFGNRRRQAAPRSLCLGAEGVFCGTPLESIPGSPVMSPQKRRANQRAAQRTQNASKSEATLLGFRPPPGLSPPRRFCPGPAPALPPHLPPTFTHGPQQRTMSEQYHSEPALPPAPAFPPHFPDVIPQGTQQRSMTEQPFTTAMVPSCSLPVLAYSPSTGVAPQAAPPKRFVHDSVLPKGKQDDMPVKVELPELVQLSTQMLDPTLPVKKKSLFADSLGETACMNYQHLDSTLPVKKRVSTFLLMEPPHVLPNQLQPQ